MRNSKFAPITQFFPQGIKLFSIMVLLMLATNALFAQCSYTCDGNPVGFPKQASPNQNCDIPLTFGIAMDTTCMNGALPNLPSFSFTVKDKTGAVLYGPANTVTIDGSLYLGDTLEVIVVHPQQTCSTFIHIEDKLAPQFTCSTDTIEVFCNQDTSANNDITQNSGAIPHPSLTAGQCLDGVTLSHSDNVINLPCTNTYTAIIKRTWTATDLSGNSSTCLQVIGVKTAKKTDVVFPIDPIFEIPCSQAAIANDTSFTGFPTINGSALTSFCDAFMTHTDVILPGAIPGCYANYVIKRTWTVWICGQDTSDEQFIKVTDTQKPTITCPADFTVSTSGNSCTANVTLPVAQANDACSSTTVTPSWNYGAGIQTGYGPFIGVPTGTHIVTYKVTDDCTNMRTCTMQVTVADEIAPIAICDSTTVVSIGSDGTAKVPAASFDSGSYDNCGPITKKVIRMDDATGVMKDSVMFMCNDIANGPVSVMYQVTDLSGNVNTCMVVAIIQDKLSPTIACPANLTLNCNSSQLSNQATWGDPVYFDNCDATPFLTTAVNTNLTNCGVGTIKRTFTVKDDYNNKNTCTQTITVVNNDPFSLADIVWPKDTMLTTCTNPNTLDPEDLPAGYDKPTWSLDYCALPALSHTDQLFDIATPACYKILRKWTVADWCQSDPLNPNAGKWSHTQIIAVLDNTPPVITCPANVTFSLGSNCDSVLVPLPTLTYTDCSPLVSATYMLSTSNNVYNGFNPTRFFKKGITTVTFKVTDGCGNLSTCSFTVTVDDYKDPSIVCINGLSANLVNMTLNNGTTQPLAMVTASMFISSVSDNCTPASLIKLRIRKHNPNATTPPNTTQLTYDCDDQGMQEVDIWAIDLNGNADYCTTFIDIQDNNNLCPLTTTTVATVSGGVQTEDGENIEEVTVTVVGPIQLPFTTGASGSYMAENLPIGDNYSVVPQKDMNPLNGVTTYDLVLIAKHILGVQPFDSPYKILAADINKSNNVSGYDIVELRKLILHVVDDFNENTSWRFVPKTFIFPNVNNPWETDFPEVYNINELPESGMIADFVGIKIGDVNMTAEANNLLGSAEAREENTLHFVTQNQTLKSNNEYTIDIKAKDFNNIQGFQGTLRFDANIITIENIEGIGLNTNNDNFGFNKLPQGILTFSWNDNTAKNIANNEPVLRLKINAKEDANLNDILRISSEYTHAEAYAGKGGNVTITGLDLQFETSSNTTLISNDNFDLYQNQPNPFDKTTHIGFNLPESGEVIIQLFNVSGSLLRTYNLQANKGYNEINVDKADLPSGILYYQLTSGANTAVKKMIIK